MGSKYTVTYLNPGHPDISLPIQLQPGFSAEVTPGHVHIFCDHDVQDAWDEEYGVQDRDAWGELGFPNGISLDTPQRKSELEIAIDLWVARAVSEFHEILEFTKLDGNRLADPHPGGVNSPEEAEMWEWVYRRVRRLATDYMKRYPLEA